MGLFISNFSAVATLLVIGILGFWLLSKRILIGNVLPPLSALTIDIALPCLIFTNITYSFEPQQTPLWWTMPLWWLAFTALVWIMTMTFSFISSRNNRREFRLSLFFQNGIFFPLAIIVEMFGSQSSYLVDLFLFTLFYPAFFFNTAPLFFGKHSGIRLKRILNPVLVATLLAIAIRLAGLNQWIPLFVSSGLKLVGAMTVPLLMIILGGNIFIDFERQGRLFLAETLKFVALKNMVFPLIVLVLLLLVRPVFHVALIIILQSAVPPITAVPIITEREGGNRSIVNQFMVASFFASLISLPVIMMLFGFFFSP